jgi:ferric-dicitrate binding protein FerR (iron transport regulator)
MLDSYPPSCWKEIKQLADRACDGHFSEFDSAQLGELLSRDPIARSWYLAYMRLNACLDYDANLSSVLGQASVPSDAPAVGISTVCSEETQAVANPRGTNLRATRWSRSRTWLRRHRYSAASITAVAVAFYGVFVLLAWNLRPEVVRRATSPESSSPAAAVVATITAEQDCVWQADSRAKKPYVGRRLHTDESLQLRTGVAELAFADGAQVVLEGPCRFELQTAGKGYLRSGKLAAHVPLRAVGFEVETPTARVVDLGTDFGLEVNSQETKLAVIEGKVDLFPAASVGKDSRTPQRIRRVVAGEAVTISTRANGVAIVRETKFDAGVSAMVPKAPRSANPSQVVAYQVSENSAGNQRDFLGAVGLDFEVRKPIRVFSLGVFDHLGDGIDSSTSPTVQLWSRYVYSSANEISDDDGFAVLGSVVFTARDPGELKLGHRFKPLSKPIDLPVGSYSIVAYGLSSANPFITFEGDHDVDFSRNPNWMGSNNTTSGNNYGWSSSTNEAGMTVGEVGGTFAAQVDSFYGDTHLANTFNLGNKITASGKLDLRNITSGWSDDGDSGFFIGHFSETGGNQKFVGLEFKNSGSARDAGYVQVRARLKLQGGAGGAASGWTCVSTGSHNFSYTYDPQSGDNGRLTVNIDGQPALVTDLMDGERNSGAQFNAFGIGITNNPNSESDSTKTAQVFIDDLSYSGFQGAAAKFTPETSAVRMQVETSRGAIVPFGPRWGKGEPSTFPKMFGERPSGCVAGSFEYCLQREGKEQ